MIGFIISLLFEVSILFTEEKACYKTMGTVINRQNEIERNIAEMEKGIQETAPCINKLRKIFKGLQNTLYNERKPKMYINSEMFYKQQIEQLDKKEKELDDALQRLDKYAQEIGVDDLSFKEIIKFKIEFGIITIKSNWKRNSLWLKGKAMPKVI